MFNPNEHLMNLKGKDYLQVMWRLVWFRDEKPNWCIDTKLESLTENHAVFSAKIFDESGIQKSAGYGSESVNDFKDFIEKAETKAVGRALAMLGYGTQFSPELDEGDRIVDSPVARAKKGADPYPDKDEYVCVKCGKPFVEVEYNGKKLTPKMQYYGAVNSRGEALCKDCYLAKKNEA